MMAEIKFISCVIEQDYKEETTVSPFSYPGCLPTTITRYIPQNFKPQDVAAELYRMVEALSKETMLISDMTIKVTIQESPKKAAREMKIVSMIQCEREVK